MKEYIKVYNRILGRAIREARDKEGLSVLKLALEVGIDNRTLQRIESGESTPTSFTLFKIHSVVPFDISATYDIIKKEIQNLQNLDLE